MVQRVQSLFLLLSAFLSFLKGIKENQFLFDNGNYCLNIGVNQPFLIVSFISVLIIFLYKKRLYQIKLCKFNVFINTLICIYNIVYVINPSIWGIQSEIQFSCRITIWWFIPLVNILLILLALYYIKKDDDLIKSIDRIR